MDIKVKAVARFSKKYSQFLNLKIDKDFLSQYGDDLRNLIKDDAILQISVSKWVEKRTLNQNNIFHSICRQIANHEYQYEIRTREMTESECLGYVKEGIKEQAIEYGYPDVNYKSSSGKVLNIPKKTSASNKKEMALMIETALNEAAFRRIDVREEILNYSNWIDKCNGNEDPLESTYLSIEDYRSRHHYCEISGEWLGDCPDSEGYWNGQVAHLVSRGAGGTDDYWNILRLSTAVHIMLQHQKGWEAVFEKYPNARAKYDRAVFMSQQNKQGELNG